MAELSKQESFQYPATHFGHLSDTQQQALDEFKKIVHDKGYYLPAGAHGRKHATHDDETLL
jgi:hypothetical protein